MKIQATLLAVVLLSAGTVVAQEETVTDLDKFKLWNECGSLRLSVESLHGEADAIGLAREDVLVAVRSRLRSARIYTTDTGTPWLYINVNVTSRAFSVSVQYRKFVLDYVSGLTRSATTWDIGGTGTHGDDAGYILSLVSRYTDSFIDEYLRVNEEACSPASN